MELKGAVFSTAFLLTISSVCLQKTCPPPNYPLGGSVSQKKSSYRVGDTVTYSCEKGRTLFGEKESVCSQTKWNQPVPFCDSPTKLRSPSSPNESDRRNLQHLIDKNTETCLESVTEIKVSLENPAPVHAVKLFLKKGEVSFEIEATWRSTPFICNKCQRYIDADQWVKLDCLHPNKTESLTIRDKHGKPNKLGICEFEAFVEDKLWCPDPPPGVIENGALEVSRRLAILHCAKGFNVSSNDRIICENKKWEESRLSCRETLCENSYNRIAIEVWVEVDFKERPLTPGSKRQLICPSGYHIEGEPSIVTCLTTGNWTRTNATCVENPPVKASSTKTIVIAVGVIGVLVIIFFMGLTIYLLHKRGSREVVVVYKPETGGFPTTQESEYSNIYYGTQSDSFTPLTPPKPPHLQPKIDPDYAKPYNQQTPVDLAFGTLKTSALYDALND